MIIHVVRSGETPETIALNYGVDAARLAADNAVPTDGILAEGQTLVIRFPAQIHTVREGDTLTSIANEHEISVRELWRRNWTLQGGELLRSGQTLVISYRDEVPLGSAAFNGYAYPFIGENLLNAQLPYLTYLAPFTYGIDAQGNLLNPGTERLLDAARQHGTLPVMHLSTLTEDGTFNTARGAMVLTDRGIQAQLIEDVARTVRENGYSGVDVDFEYLPGELAQSYAEFLGRLRETLWEQRCFLWAALAPKISDTQPGLLYEGHDYAAVARNTDAVLLMTYEWGYTYGPPMPVSPLPNVRAVLDYALTRIPPGQIYLGLSNYGYDWTLPFIQGESRADSISMQKAFSLAVEHHAVIAYDETAQAPFFYYTDENARDHIVWFDDARSMAARAALIAEYGFQGAGIWNIMRPSAQTWQVLDALYNIQ